MKDDKTLKLMAINNTLLRGEKFAAILALLLIGAKLATTITIDILLNKSKNKYK